ncbi:hypothetical protein HPO96_37165 [Kribbella sandramycini]|uniref:Uncharacterized protein n=1 Tax=Kribbella sandramycini TaxID=60450 RepID=A0A7Y4P3H4_9ACTN|nr:hypothetical protein [Kribbella sandramycini]MBB6564433.1 hypothetical protein [Kribbella sandramycini]NOL45891.1 hypothetical protein [Kribbella sandramycini]
MSAFDDIFSGEGNEDLRAAFTAAEKDFSDAENLTGGASSGAMVYPTSPDDSVGAESRDGTAFGAGYRELPNGTRGYIFLQIDAAEAWLDLDVARELHEWLGGRIAHAAKRGAK